MQRNDDTPAARAELKRSLPRVAGALPEFVRFAAVGGASAAIYFVLLWFFAVVSSWSLTVRATLAYGTGILFNYLVQKSFTFRSARRHHHAGPRYLIVQGGGMLINSAVLWLGVDVQHWWYPPVQVAAILLTATWSYVGQKFWAFDGPRPSA